MIVEDKKRYNVHDVAKAAGVSSMTVTRVFNDSAPVAAATREKVMAVAKKLNYRPSRMARTLRQGRSNSIGLLWSLSGPHDSAGVVRQMTQLISQAGYVTYLTDTMSDPTLVKNCLSDLIERKVDGVIIQVPTDETNLDRYAPLLHEIGKVVMVAGNKPEKKLTCDYIHRNLYYGIVDCMASLFKSGRRRIALLYSQKKKMDELMSFFSGKEYESCISYCKVYGNHQKIGYHVFPDSLEKYWNDEQPFDAICCSCDEGAARVINLLHDKGLKVPDDVAVCGINNTSITECFRPQIASIDRKNSETAETAVKMLLNRIKHPEMEPQFAEIKMEFIPRESAGLK